MNKIDTQIKGDPEDSSTPLCDKLVRYLVDQEGSIGEIVSELRCMEMSNTRLRKLADRLLDDEA